MVKTGNAITANRRDGQRGEVVVPFQICGENFLRFAVFQRHRGVRGFFVHRLQERDHKRLFEQDVFDVHLRVGLTVLERERVNARGARGEFPGVETLQCNVSTRPARIGNPRVHADQVAGAAIEAFLRLEDVHRRTDPLARSFDFRLDGERLGQTGLLLSNRQRDNGLVENDGDGGIEVHFLGVGRGEDLPDREGLRCPKFDADGLGQCHAVGAGGRDRKGGNVS